MRQVTWKRNVMSFLNRSGHNFIYKNQQFAYNVQVIMGIERILFYKPGAIGDFLHSLPSLKALKRAFPAALITVVVSPGQERLVQGTPIADQILVYNKAHLKKSVTDFLSFGLQLRREHVDLFVDMQPSVRSWVLRKLSGAGRIVVYRKQKLVGPGARRLHAVENFMRTLEPLGISEAIDHIDLPIIPEAAAKIDRFLAEQGIARHQPLVALNCSVGAARPSRNWFPERFTELADRLASELGALVIFIGGSEDRKLVAGVMAAMHTQAITTAGMFDLAESAALLARCRCLVSSDTGPLHLATAVQTATIGLYGSTDPRRTGPVGRNTIVLAKQLPCIPCEKKHCPLNTVACMRAISVNDVVEAVRCMMPCK
jgi:lipopolysaccharide heptosyltransferase II